MSYQREFKQRIRIGMVGAGNHSYRNIFPALHYLPVELVAICDVNEEIAQLTASEYGCKHYTSTAQMYDNENLDAVLLVVSPLHPSLAIEAFGRGLHVWMEKPVSMRAHEVEEMIEHRSDRVAMVGFKKVFMPSTRKALEMVESKKYGNLKSILAVYPMTIAANGKEVLESREFTNWLANGCHPLSFLMRIGGQVRSVTTNRSPSGHGIVFLEFVNGVTGTFHFASGPLPIESYSLFGDKWNMTIDNSLTVTFQRGIPFEYNKTNNYVTEGEDTGSVVWRPQNSLSTLENKSLFTQGIFGELDSFCRCIIEGKAADEGSLEFALEVMKVYEAALLSEGKPVEIN